MKGLSTLITLQALLSTVSGIMMSKMSLVGKVSIYFLYRDYGVLKIWWKTALILFGVQLLLIFVLWLSKKLLSTIASRIVAVLFILLILGGTYLTYLDFTNTSHRYLNQQFHIGAYLVWVAAAITCVFFIFVKIKRNLTPIKKEINLADTHLDNEND